MIDRFLLDFITLQTKLTVLSNNEFMSFKLVHVNVIFVSRTVCNQNFMYSSINLCIINIDHMQQNKMTLSDVFLYNGMYHFVLSTK